MSFQDNLATLPAIDHLSGLDVCDTTGAVLHHIPAAPGKLGSLKLYHALAQEFDGKLDSAAAERGLELFAEHVADAEANPGKHPNIDLLFKVRSEHLVLTLKPLTA
ncbi:DUF2322 family protein [Neisseria animalis]|uniref:DUF2322 family protein n=1 Tax=Neisseria animalis TaxID=492 RepID=A0A5P3MNQ2_NEIAN|nr:DUF2322 family protein [Neisseria animalis]QEY23174.1 DUF2322 family protein [Neisseria animalis]ROW32505.1 DUF2322 family protein [Neisseria animalis]VEE08305.1 Uncharacterized protein conserved in bacteria [Neisseria animalis]